MTHHSHPRIIKRLKRADGREMVAKIGGSVRDYELDHRVPLDLGVRGDHSTVGMRARSGDGRAREARCLQANHHFELLSA